MLKKKWKRLCRIQKPILLATPLAVNWTAASDFFFVLALVQETRCDSMPGYTYVTVKIFFVLRLEYTI